MLRSLSDGSRDCDDKIACGCVNRATLRSVFFYLTVQVKNDRAGCGPANQRSDRWSGPVKVDDVKVLGPQISEQPYSAADIARRMSPGYDFDIDSVAGK